ncbi:hypothetical protein L208DRAFT_1269688 [Tricholoma matsutake]|nr:hypothetical protein L208DRAFT_1269688 [Tricholoma matsutake 945]
MSFVFTLLLATFVSCQSTFPATPLASKHYPSPTDLPYQVDPETDLIRGPQFGFNRCNATTQNQNSNCQTSYVNSITDFCLWGPPTANELVANTEAEMVAWCTSPGHGTRLIPRGALQGVQWMRTPDYVQVVGFIDQTQLNLQSNDTGGELDPHGADFVIALFDHSLFRGNPIGGILYSSGFTPNLEQVMEWHNFVGSGTFCFKACDPAGPNAPNYCQHIYDRIGCAYNAPNNAQNGTFESCLGDNQDFPGVYTDSTGATQTYTQPPESLGPIPPLTWTARVPKSSSCVQHQSTDLYAALNSVTPTGSAASTATPSGSAASTGSSSASGTRAPGASGTSSDAQVLAASGLVSFLGVVFSVLAFA